MLIYSARDEAVLWWVGYFLISFWISGSLTDGVLVAFRKDSGTITELDLCLKWLDSFLMLLLFRLVSSSA